MTTPIDLMEDMPQSLHNVGVFQDGSAPEEGQFDGYFRAIDQLSHRNTVSMKGFLDSTVFKDDDQKFYAHSMLACGQIELDAPCNNRLDAIKTHRIQLQILLEHYDCKGLVNEDPSVYALDEYRLLLPLVVDFPEDLDPFARQHAASIIEQIEEIQLSVRRDQQLGEFVDYGKFKRVFLHIPDDQKLEVLANSEIGAPRFIAELSSYCAAISSGYRENFIVSMLRGLGFEREGSGIKSGPATGMMRRQGFFRRQQSGALATPDSPRESE